MRSFFAFICLTALTSAISTSNPNLLGSNHITNNPSDAKLDGTIQLEERRVAYNPHLKRPSQTQHDVSSSGKWALRQGSLPGQKLPAGQISSDRPGKSSAIRVAQGHRPLFGQYTPPGRDRDGHEPGAADSGSKSPRKSSSFIKSTTVTRQRGSATASMLTMASTSAKPILTISDSSDGSIRSLHSTGSIVSVRSVTPVDSVVSATSSTPYPSSVTVRPGSSARASSPSVSSTADSSGQVKSMISVTSSSLGTKSSDSQPSSAISASFSTNSISNLNSSLIGSASTTSSAAAATITCAGNSAADRTQWCDFSIDTDWNEEAPNTGVTREYWLEITNITSSPDGYERIALAVNGSIPGPTIEANWGDTVKIHVKNSLTNNGTTMHWHGLRQNYTVQNDGVPSIIQCPDAPGTTHTYVWRATQYGTSWYHSHYALQAWTGVFGPIVIHGPATANYDLDLGPVMFTDWSHKTVDALWTYAQTKGPPTLDTALINGKGTFNGSGERYKMSFQSGKKHRMRFINSAIDTSFKLSLDNHTMTVIAMDLVPIVPFQIDVLDITMGQRYDVVIEANQTATDYWFRAVPQAACSNNDNTNDIRAIVRYNENSTADPTTTAWSQTDACVDVSYSSLVPHVSHTVVSPALQNTTLAVTVAKDSSSLFKWSIGMDSMKVIWNNPSLLQIAEGNATWDTAENAYLLPDANRWIYWVIDTNLPVPHPIHLHGHDFYILAQQGGATYNASTVTLNLDNPPRRDVALLPASGYLVIAFYTDNPGTWLMHCHIGWHVAEGLAVQFVERQSEIAALLDAAEIESTCEAWKEFNSGTLEIEQDDSGV